MKKKMMSTSPTGYKPKNYCNVFVLNKVFSFRLFHDYFHTYYRHLQSCPSSDSSYQTHAFTLEPMDEIRVLFDRNDKIMPAVTCDYRSYAETLEKRIMFLSYKLINTPQ